MSILFWKKLPATDALNDLLIKIFDDLKKSSSWEIDLLCMTFQLAAKKITRHLDKSNRKLPSEVEKFNKIVWKGMKSSHEAFVSPSIWHIFHFERSLGICWSLSFSWKWIDQHISWLGNISRYLKNSTSPNKPEMCWIKQKCWFSCNLAILEIYFVGCVCSQL